MSRLRYLHERHDVQRLPPQRTAGASRTWSLTWLAPRQPPPPRLRLPQSQRYRNAKATSKPANFKSWVRASQAMLIAGAVFGPVMGVAAAGLAHGGRTADSVVVAANVKAASAWVRPRYGLRQAQGVGRVYFGVGGLRERARLCGRRCDDVSGCSAIPKLCLLQAAPRPLRRCTAAATFSCFRRPR
jgi:hypothetical protein